MICPQCSHPNKTYLDYCSRCHHALDGSDGYEYGHGPGGRLPEPPEPRDLPWIFLLGAVLCWGIAAWGTFRLLSGRAHAGNPYFLLQFWVWGTAAYVRYRHEKSLSVRTR